MIVMLLIGQIIALAPEHDAMPKHSAGQLVAMSVMEQGGAPEAMSPTDHQIHHSAGGHCVGCGILGVPFGLPMRLVARIKTVASAAALALPRPAPLLRPPITTIS